MNLNEYIEINKRKIREFICEKGKDRTRGICYDNIGQPEKKLIPAPDVASNDYFNKNRNYRRITEEFLLNVKNEHNTMIYTELEFASTKDSVDKSRKLFEKKILILFEEYKSQILKEYLKFVNTNETQKIFCGYLLKTDLSFIKINLDSDDPDKKGEVSNVLFLLGAVYNLIWQIEDKKAKLKDFTDIIHEKHRMGSDIYLKVIGYWGELYTEKDYEKFIQLYDKIIKLNDLLYTVSRVYQENTEEYKNAISDIDELHLEKDYEEFIKKYNKLMKIVSSKKAR